MKDGRQQWPPRQRLGWVPADEPAFGMYFTRDQGFHESKILRSGITVGIHIYIYTHMSLLHIYIYTYIHIYII